jgi:hypothetical protein
MRKNPDRTCWTCGELIKDRAKRSACYCKKCAENRRQAYLQAYYVKAKSGLFQAAAGCLMYGIMVEQEECVRKGLALSLMSTGVNQKKNVIGGNEYEAVELV